MDLETSLGQLGLHPKQIKVYLVLLQMGEATIQEITSKSKVKRTSVYKALDNLVLRGLVTFVDKGWHRQYYAENPRKALIEVKDEQREIVKKEKRLLELMPELVARYNSIPAKPKTRYFEGVEGLKQVYEEIFYLPAGSEILSITSAGMLYYAFDEAWIKEYLVRRVAGKISCRSIAEDSPESKKHQVNDKAEHRITRLVPKEKFPFKNEITIFGNKVAIVSPRDQMGIVVESVDVADTQRAWFELAWEAAEKYKSK